MGVNGAATTRPRSVGLQFGDVADRDEAGGDPVVPCGGVLAKRNAGEGVGVGVGVGEAVGDGRSPRSTCNHADHHGTWAALLPSASCGAMISVTE